ncbi:Basic helix-loop-helix DNA-binding superfamily protein, putative isoform 2 [Hibiscus syriacus]|uniref:Basic helix-loop-helix DNA-binding superfamily protein, putative isoform 2 n=1 Tax=Hibiscus syriacus TaxID=106335 RepID=A0A6A3CWC9_HIBSY|nr:Basic helix-loop-helix DNA-binding superfamily protein, putative isoform 2 [Hibiscus syriacus]
MVSFVEVLGIFGFTLLNFLSLVRSWCTMGLVSKLLTQLLLRIYNSVMELNEGTAGIGSNKTASESDEVAAPELLQVTDKICRLMLAPVTNNASSFTALLEPPVLQAVQLIQSPDSSKLIAAPAPAPNVDVFKGSFHFPFSSGLIERAAKFSMFTGDDIGNINGNNKSNSPEPRSYNSSASHQKPVKSEPGETETLQPLVSDPTVENRSIKRKDIGKVKGSTKKRITAAEESSDNTEKLPYDHVRSRWGEATDSHCSAEGARIETINARMKLLQELISGCSTISSTALELDEIINHVQSIQRPVEFLSMRLDAVFDQLASVRKPGFSLAAMLMSFTDILANSDNPIKLNFWPILFAIALLCSHFLKDRSRKASRLYCEGHTANASQQISVATNMKHKNFLLNVRSHQKFASIEVERREASALPIQVERNEATALPIQVERREASALPI